MYSPSARHKSLLTVLFGAFHDRSNFHRNCSLNSRYCFPMVPRRVSIHGEYVSSHSSSSVRSSVATRSVAEIFQDFWVTVHDPSVRSSVDRGISILPGIFSSGACHHRHGLSPRARGTIDIPSRAHFQRVDRTSFAFSVRSAPERTAIVHMPSPLWESTRIGSENRERLFS